MTLIGDILGDHALIDGTEVVTYTPVNRSPSVSADTTVTALFGTISHRQIMRLQEIGILPTDVSITVWVETMGTIEPHHGDTITRSDGTVWTILDAMYRTMDSKWTCACRKQVS